MAIDTEYFDFWSILRNELIGDTWLTIFIITIFFLFLTVKFKMPFELQFLFLILVLAMLYSQTLIILLWLAIVMAVGLIFYWMVSKALS